MIKKMTVYEPLFIQIHTFKSTCLNESSTTKLQFFTLKGRTFYEILKKIIRA